MDALVIITGRGLGGDAVVAYNVITALEKKGVHCEIALDESAPGTIFKKNGLTWHKISIPQAGGHLQQNCLLLKQLLKCLPPLSKQEG